MASTLVSTKMIPPRQRGAVVPRPRLIALMEAGADASLTLISAPAGFGKTTVLAGWLARVSTETRAVAFVSLDESDRQAPSFWLYVVSAVNGATSGVGANVLPLLTAGQPATRALLTSVLNEIEAQSNQVELILDDYHLADGPAVAEGMAFLLEHRPPNLHIVVSTRADPNLPLARLRAHGQLVEIRARDLRFSAAETAAYLTDVGGLVIATHDIAVLEARTEGWAAALQLAALSMRGRDDVAGFIAGFAGDDRNIVDYLVDEVLSRQSDEVRHFLMRASVLDPLCADLCDAALEQSGSQRMIEGLERANLFLVPLDGQRRWYRFHRLFADVLQSHLRGAPAEQVAGLHLRASHWYDRAGDAVSAVHHALAAGAVELAADLAETALPTLQRDRQEAVLCRWIGEFPVDVAGTRPVLAVGFVGALMSSNEFAAAEVRLREVERQLPAIEGGTAVDDAQLARVPSAVELYRAGLCLVAGDFSSTHLHAQLSIDTSTPADDLVRAAASGLSGLAHWAQGELDGAHRRYEACIEGLRRLGHVSDVLGCSITVADIRIAQGRLREARASYDDGLRLVDAVGGSPRGVPDMHVGLSELALERGHLAEARDHLDVARRLGEEHGLPQHPYRLREATAMLAAAEGDIRSALAWLAEAQQVYLGDFSPAVRPLPAVAARLQVRGGEVDAAAGWARDHDVTSSQELSYLREFEHVTLAEVLLARHRLEGDCGVLEDADQLLERLRAAATAGARTGALIDIVVLQAMVRECRGEAGVALALFGEAMALAEPEGQVHAFARHGRLLLPLLDQAKTLVEPLGPASWTALLIDACRGASRTPLGVEPGAAPPTEAERMADPLSGRELEVLRLLDSELDGPEIARQLFISVNTLRTHTKSIYTKLGVRNRHAAVRRGRELGLTTGP